MANFSIEFDESLDILDGTTLFLPISEADIMSRKLKGQSVFDFEELALKEVATDFPELGAEISRRLERLSALSKNLVLRACGPDEGSYYIEIPDPDNEK